MTIQELITELEVLAEDSPSGTKTEVAIVTKEATTPFESHDISYSKTKDKVIIVVITI